MITEARILRVDLSTGTIKKETVDPGLVRKYLGGRGLATKLLADSGGAKVDALSPANKLIFAPGLLAGTTAPTGGRYMVVTKSPLTGTVASSNAGGFFGAELKKAGWSMVIIEGASNTPVYLSIHDDKVELETLHRIVEEAFHERQQPGQRTADIPVDVVLVDLLHVRDLESRLAIPGYLPAVEVLEAVLGEETPVGRVLEGIRRLVMRDLDVDSGPCLGNPPDLLHHLDRVGQVLDHVDRIDRRERVVLEREQPGEIRNHGDSGEAGAVCVDVSI